LGEPPLGVGADRRSRIDGDRHEHLTRILRVQLKIGDFADADAVEGNRRARPQAGDRILETHAIDRAVAEPARRMQPIDKSETSQACDNHE